MNLISFLINLLVGYMYTFMCIRYITIYNYFDHNIIESFSLDKKYYFIYIYQKVYNGMEIIRKNCVTYISDIMFDIA